MNEQDRLGGRELTERGYVVINGSLAGKHAWVTGGASGIGLAIAREFSAAGAAVTVLDLDPAKVAEAAAQIARDTSVPCTGFACDVSDETGVADTFRAAEAGGIDILVNSAGIAHVGSVLNTPAADFDRLYRVNVRGTYLCMQAALRFMESRGRGVVLNMASIAATSGLNDRFAYSMTKGAVLAMTLSAAKDCLPLGIRCNCISPARVHTPFVDGFVAKTYPGKEAEMMAALSAAQPVGRMGTPEEIAKLARYLCSDDASFITGTDVLIDGGFTTLR